MVSIFLKKIKDHVHGRLLVFYVAVQEYAEYDYVPVALHFSY